MPIAPQIRRALRLSGSLAASVLPSDYRVRGERYLRGWEEHRLLQESDLVVVSFGKSGRTWLRVLMSRYYQLRYELPASKLARFKLLHERRVGGEVGRLLLRGLTWLACEGERGAL